ncbi:hypothetical protein JX265_012498 [Neoarthrinium moseri]|uniref:Uncharacterized protein n=1 Tax=Neoarthrinium moseri TaxID=1658444 RepID=A0A9P9WAL5_9PEZI|nr:hypothetical protein JX265_012498 [Neoarthrinium moseri]
MFAQRCHLRIGELHEQQPDLGLTYYLSCIPNIAEQYDNGVQSFLIHEEHEALPIVTDNGQIMIGHRHLLEARAFDVAPLLGIQRFKLPLSPSREINMMLPLLLVPYKNKPLH